MTLEEATALAQKQADEFGVVMEMYRDTLYADHHKEFWEIVGRCEPR
jgi:hypothetical protein